MKPPVILFILMTTSSLSLSCPQHQREALLHFKSLLSNFTESFLPPSESFDYDPRPASLEAWNLTTCADCCQWSHVTCHPSSRQVINLNLFYVSTSFPKSDVLAPLFHVQSLTSLDISYNGMEGAFPTDGFANLTKIVHLDASTNSLTASGLPPQLFSLRHLQYLDLSDNSMEGTLPRDLGNLTNLKVLNLHDNLMHGQIPKEIAKLSLDRLILSDNKLTGTLPPCLFQSKHLSILCLSNNSFSGKLPDNIGEATSLSCLSLSDNKFSGMLPKSIANLDGLYYLDLSGNGFSGEFPSSNSQSSNLQVLYISFNKFSGEVPANFGQNLVILDASQNEFTGQLPLNLANMSFLKHVDLHDNCITGKIPPLFPQMNSLQVLNPRNNSLQRHIPDDFSSSHNHRILDLSHNNLVGKIPNHLGKIAGMTDKGENCRYEYYSPLSCSELNRFPGLEIIWKKSERGFLSKSLKFYCFMDLSSNQLSGKIPVSFGDLSGLNSLNLSHNNLSREIPMSFGDLKDIESLDLSHNGFSGKIPDAFAKLQQLNVLDLSNNKLSGPIPDGSQMDRLNDPSLYANNSGVCGFQIQVPCQRKSASPPQAPREGESDENWFSWEFAGIGFPVGFFTTIVCMFCSGFFQTRPRRRRVSHRGSCFNHVVMH